VVEQWNKELKFKGLNPASHNWHQENISKIDWYLNKVVGDEVLVLQLDLRILDQLHHRLIVDLVGNVTKRLSSSLTVGQTRLDRLPLVRVFRVV